MWCATRFLSILPLAAVLLLVGCAGGSRPYSYEIDPNIYIVQSGDTLEAISWRYQVPIRDLVLWNNLQAGADLRPGARLMVRRPPQVLTERGTSIPRTAPRAETRPAARASGQQTAASGNSASPVVVSRPSSKVVRDSVAARPTSVQPAPRARVVPREVVQTPAVAPPRPAPPIAPVPGNVPATTARVSGITWQWPVNGRLVSSFSNGQPGRQGLKIAGQVGQPVRAVADGQVVYSGTGLVAYGKLVIVKHNGRLLSAYGHNQRLAVNEGDTVRAGQVIAYMGEDEERRARLHFEIRKDGKPVNPAIYLPRL